MLMAPTEPRKQVNQQKDCPSDPPSKGDLDEDSTKKGRENAATWYMKSWPRKSKAPAVTEVARESISATNPILSERTRSSTSVSRPSRTQSIGLMKKGRSSTRSLPADVATTRINIASNTGSSPASNTGNGLSPVVKPENEQDDAKQGFAASLSETKGTTKTDGHDRAKQTQDADEKLKPDPTAERDVQKDTVNRSSGWFGWLSRSKDDADSTVPSENIQNSTAGPTPDKSQAEIDHVPETEAEVLTRPRANPEQDEERASTLEPTKTPEKLSTTVPQKRPWLYMWTGSPTVQQEELPEIRNFNQALDKDSANSSDQTNPSQAENMQPARNNVSTAVNDNVPEKDVSKSTTWLFWPRERQETGAASQETPEAPLDSVQQKEVETLVDKIDSQATGVLSKITPKKSAKGGSIRSTKGVTVDLSTSEPSSESAKQQQVSGGVKRSQALPNQLLPPFENTFPLQDRPGILQQLGRLIYYGRGPEPRHVHRLQGRPQIRKALAIGIHGYFPAPLIRNIIGQPTGTSVKFATMAEKAILQWAEAQDSPCEVEKIILEGEGRISERVDLLWKLLLNWIDHVRSADFIMISCHSQGVPVATMLVAKLIAFGCVNSARIGICAMAGINLGPFPDYRSRWISGSAGELFDFADSKSSVSQDYMAALEVLLDYGVRITYVGSIDDQLVSLESSVFATISHPYIHRAVFVDGRVHAPSFVSHLVGFTMKLRNLGISDHGLIRELSSPLAGSLYSGEGHSRLYDDLAVYELAVRFTLETTSVPATKLQVSKLRTSSPTNPYILPFAMRGVLEEDYVRRELSEETTQLLKQFDDWKPSTKVLKDVKFRLEGIRSKL
ncbi:hypothetical protein PRK78_006475 [Emydomyces testavorans]|uniref:YMC020W-like alpha/beta hydrolase domain-containing protein n=1 Tax=Emydomyces testavorans TaxID=2070801 RepID=A0AAF0ILQ3_9EURO|nr:hypothetical protein PRK78_006475 [Emydomyces testavorans]